MDTKRKQRVAELIRNNASQIILRDVAPMMPAMVTVMRVEMSDDLKYATMSVSFFGDEESKKRSFNILKKELKNIRKQLGGVIRLRHLPYIVLLEDSSLDHAFKIEELLGKIRKDDEKEKPV